ncbi:hypothetical protein GALMADRAFT_249776 [Galerina marginata CBS 339.88]|uniref:Condensation domain-containing protein n=1 Tax=Galerina marginata (strain CBS 339.88) TaxID=685588 RepID=A0A067SXT4_GALM3|nr:hypothetical protein GALMADRAFT_249776 [Galerina marginata CBS 339.88]
MHPVGNEPGWKVLNRGCGDEYSRPLLGSELLNDQFAQCFDGFSECCMGFTFETRIPFDEFCSSVRHAWAHLRFRCPNIAASLETIHDPQLRSWVYRPATSQEDIAHWLQNSVIIHPEPTDVQEFISETIYGRLEDRPGRFIMYCIIFPVRGRENVFGVFMHGSHALMDPRATMNAFKIMCSKMVESKPSPFEDLAWGTEWKNLPDGPVTSTGGPLPGWEERGAPILSRYLEAQTVKPDTWTLCPQRRDITDHGRAIRVRSYIQPPEVLALTQAVKAGGFSMDQLFQAAQALAVCKMNPIPEDQLENAHVSFPHVILSLDRWRTDPNKDQFVSGQTFMSVRIDHTLIASSLPPKEKLCAIMTSLKLQSEFFLKNEHLPHLCAAMMALNPPRTMRVAANRFTTGVTNIGVVDRIIPLEWVVDGGVGDSAARGEPLFRLSEWFLGVRYTEPNPTTHVWTMGSKMCVQVMAADTWDKDYLQRYADEIIQQALNLLIC